MGFVPRRRKGMKDERKGKEKGDGDGAWDELRSEEGLSVKLETMGSVYLVWQAVLPVLLFPPPSLPSISSESNREISEEDKECTKGGKYQRRLRLRLHGGTFASFAPTTFYVRHVLIPTLSRVVGLQGLALNVKKEGFSTGPRPRDSGGSSVGEVVLDVTPFAPEESIKAFSLEERGEVVKLGICIAAHESLLPAVESATRTLLARAIEEGRFGAKSENANGNGNCKSRDEDQEKEKKGDIEIETRETLTTPFPSHLSLLLLAETSTGCVLARDCLWDHKIPKTPSPSGIQETAHSIARKVVNELVNEVEKGGCVDEHMADQIVVFQALSGGEGKINYGYGVREGGEEGGRLSLHARTARWVGEQVLGKDRERERGCWFEEELEDLEGCEHGGGAYRGVGYKGLGEWEERERSRVEVGEDEDDDEDGRRNGDEHEHEHEEFTLERRRRRWRKEADSNADAEAEEEEEDEMDVDIKETISLCDGEGGSDGESIDDEVEAEEKEGDERLVSGLKRTSIS